MATTSNVYSQGGGGNQFENEVQTAFFLSFLIGCKIPGLPECHIIEYKQQASSLGYLTDDLLIKCIDSASNEHRILIQIKHSLIISENSETLKEVLFKAWKDFNNSSLFNREFDKIYIVKYDLTKSEKNDLKTILEWAKYKATLDDFNKELLTSQKKKRYFDLFKAIVEEEDKNVTDQNIFSFLKCFDILEYDLGIDTSLCKSNFLTLIESIRISNTSAVKIWNDVFAFVSSTNSKGGLFTVSTLPTSLTAYFDSSVYNETLKKLVKLSNQGSEIINFIEDTIGEIKIPRKALLENAIELLNNNQILLLSGDPGVGKSALAKSILQNISISKTGLLLVFKADELINNNLKELFSQVGDNLTVKDIFSNFPLSTENFIYVDSAEKLLEGEGIGFTQLVKSLESLPNIKLILSCRSVNLNLIERKYLFKKSFGKLEISILTDDEIRLLEAEFPIIVNLKRNIRLLTLIRNPKYLDFTIKSLSDSTSDYTNSTEIDFIRSLWETIVENKLNANFDGLPQRRSDLFIEIATTRAKKMLPFVTIDNVDKIALHELEKDNVIVKSSNSYSYAPAHDILEDWALIRFVSQQFSFDKTNVEFFRGLGTEPAMRRAYRLWVQNALKEYDTPKINFFSANLTDTSLDRFWQDESLIALLNSDYFEKYLNANIETLKLKDWELLFRIAHLMRTACKENRNLDKDVKIALPTGFGWVPIIKLINEKIKEFPEGYYFLVLNIVSDWSSKLLTTISILDGEREAGLVILYLLEYFEKKSNYSHDDSQVQKCLHLLFKFCGGVVEETQSFLNTAVANYIENDNDPNWRQKRYYEKVLHICLSGIHSGNLPRHLPNLLISIAKEIWYEKPVQIEDYGSDLISYLSRQHRADDVNHHFGLTNEYDAKYFPSSAYQTFTLNLLRNEPYLGMTFIVELLNYSTEKYSKSSFSQDDGVVEIELQSSGKKLKQIGSTVLWMMFRGTGKVTPYLLQSVLMSLEFYLLEIAELGEASKKVLLSQIDFLYTQSTSVAITAVISSVCQAYPILVEDKFLPLISSKEIIFWDISRYASDYHPFNFFIQEEIYDIERGKSNKLPHRLKFTPGLKGFIVDYCFNIRVYNKQIFECIDTLRSSAEKDDLGWKKMLDEMDVRTWKYSKEITHNGKLAFLIEPSYSDEIMPYVDEITKPLEESNKNTSYKVLLLKAKKKEETIEILNWREIYDYYKSFETLVYFEHVPGLLAVIGVRDLWNDLNMEEKEWCIQVIVENTVKQIQKQNSPYDYSNGLSPFDEDAILSSIPLLFTLPELLGDENNLQNLTINLLTTHFQLNDPGYKSFLRSFANSMWETSSALALKFFKGTISYAQFLKKNPVPHFQDENVISKYSKKLENHTKKILNNRIEIDFSKINFTNYSWWVLLKTVYLIPSSKTPSECILFLKQLIEIYVEKEAAREGRYNNEERLHEIRIALTEKIGEIIFWDIDNSGCGLLDFILQKANEPKIMTSFWSGRSETHLFFRDTIKKLIFIGDYNYIGDERQTKEKTVSQFKNVWFAFEKILAIQKSHLFSDILLLNIEWRETSKTWEPIIGMHDFFERNIKTYGQYNIHAVINLVSHVGDEMLLPEAVNWIVDLLKNASTPETFPSQKYAEHLVNRIYENHLQSVKNNSEYLKNYLWMLDSLTANGCSDAYWIREYLISFR